MTRVEELRAPGTRPQEISRPLTGARAVAEVIACQEDATVIGMPGGHTMQIYDALYTLQDRVRTLLVRQESVATVMAEARGRLTGAPTFVIGQGAWVLGNASIGIMEAHLGASPMVLLIDATDGGGFSHHGPYQAGYGGYGAYDLPAALSAITKRTFVATDATQALQMTQLAVKHATTGEPGPVAVVFHSRALFGRIDRSAQPPSYLSAAPPIERPTPSATAISRAAALIASAQRPVIIAGNGIRLAAAERELREFVRRTGIPVATTPAGKGTFPEDDPLAAGVIGSFGHECANALVGDADLLLAIGTKLGASDTANAHPALIDIGRQSLIHVDVESLNLSWTLPSDVDVLGDARDVIPALARALPGFSSNGVARVAEARSAAPAFEREVRSSPGALSGRDVVAVLSQEAPRTAIVTCDAGENRLFVLREFQSKEGGTVLQPNGGGGMGYAVPAAMAAAVTRPHQAAIAVCGDGGFSMTMTALMSAIELKLDLTVIVLDNGVLGWVYSGQRGRVIASELQRFDYAAIAEAMGAHVATVSDLDAVRAALRGARERSGVSLIVARTSTDDRYQHLMSALNRDDVYAVAGDDDDEPVEGIRPALV